jgi:hypothetical protein
MTAFLSWVFSVLFTMCFAVSNFLPQMNDQAVTEKGQIIY